MTRADRPWAYHLAELLSRGLSRLPFQLASSPLIALLLLVLACRWPRERAALLFLGGSAAGMIALVCLVNEPTGRYLLQTVPFLTLGLAVVAARWVGLDGAQDQAAPEESPG